VKGDLKREAAAGGEFSGREREVRPEGHRAMETGEGAHFRDDRASRKTVPLGGGWIGADVVGLDDAGAKAAEAGDVIVVDGEQA
jgi:hypothetical protein